MMIDYELWPHLSPSIVLILGNGKKKSIFFTFRFTCSKYLENQKIISVLNFNTTEFNMTDFHL